MVTQKPPSTCGMALTVRVFFYHLQVELRVGPAAAGAVTNQLWQHAADGTLKLAGTTRCLEVRGASVANAAALQIADCVGELTTLAQQAGMQENVAAKAANACWICSDVGACGCRRREHVCRFNRGCGDEVHM